MISLTAIVGILTGCNTTIPDEPTSGNAIKATKNYERFVQVDNTKDGIPEYVIPKKYRLGDLELWPNWENLVKGNEAAITTGNARRGDAAFITYVTKGKCWDGSLSRMTYSDCSASHKRSYIAIEKPEVGPSQYHITNGWMSLSLYLPKDYKADARKHYMDQLIYFKPDPGAGKLNKKIGYPAFFNIITQGGNIHVLEKRAPLPKSNEHPPITHSQTTIGKVDDLKGKWTDIYIHFNLVKGSKGFFEVYFGDELKYKTEVDKGIIDWTASKWKPTFGIRHFSGLYRNDAYVMYDEVKLGKTRESVDIDRGKPIN